MKSLRCLAVVPIYEAMTGNICVYYGLKGEAVKQPFTVQTQMRRFFREHRIDEKEYQKKARRVLGIFMPVKVRVPIARSDGAYAYVRYEAIQDISDNQILLTTGEPLDCLQSRRSLAESLARAGTIQAVLCSEEARAMAERELLRMKMQQAKKVLDDLTKYG